MNTWSTIGGIPFYPGWSDNGKVRRRRRGDRARPDHRGIEIGGLVRLDKSVGETKANMIRSRRGAPDVHGQLYRSVRRSALS